MQTAVPNIRFQIPRLCVIVGPTVLRELRLNVPLELSVRIMGLLRILVTQILSIRSTQVPAVRAIIVQRVLRVQCRRGPRLLKAMALVTSVVKDSIVLVAQE
jgi:hypothetical protein